MCVHVRTREDDVHEFVGVGRGAERWVGRVDKDEVSTGVLTARKALGEGVEGADEDSFDDRKALRSKGEEARVEHGKRAVSVPLTGEG